jgi:hypothetical protein
LEFALSSLATASDE